MADQLSGAELDARFFEVCLPSRMARIGVSTDASVCEAWAMRWAREQGFETHIQENELGIFASLKKVAVYVVSSGTDWKEAFVRACVAAGEILNQSKGGA